MFLRKFLQKLLNVPIEVPIASSEEAYYLFREGKRRGRERKYAFEMWLKLSHSFQSLYQFYDHPSFNFYPEEAPLIIKRMIELCSSIEEAEKVKDKIEAFGKSKEKAKVKICTKLKDDLFFKAYSLVKNLDGIIFLIDITAPSTKKIAYVVGRNCFNEAIDSTESVVELIEMDKKIYHIADIFDDNDNLLVKFYKKMIDLATFKDIIKVMNIVCRFKRDISYSDGLSEDLRSRWNEICNSISKTSDSIDCIYNLEKIIDNDRWHGEATTVALEKVKEMVCGIDSIKELSSLYSKSKMNSVQDIIMKAWTNIIYERLSGAKDINDLFPLLLFMPANPVRDMVSKFNTKLSEIAYESAASALNQGDLQKLKVIYQYSPIESKAEELILQAIKEIELKEI